VEEAPARTTFAEFPMFLEDWRGVPQPPLSPQILAVLGATDTLVRWYHTPERETVSLYMGYWSSQRQGDTIHSPLNCVPGAGWEPLEHSILRIADPRSPSAGEIGINRYIIQKGLDRQLVLYWYQSHGRIVASEYWGKFYLVADAVRLNRTNGSIVRVIAPIKNDVPDGVEAAEAVALRFVRTLLPALNPYIP
jgi:EpsI family protein